MASSLFILRAWQSSRTTSLQDLFGLRLGLGPSTSYSIHFFTQSSSSFRITCPYQRSMFCCNTNAMSSIPSHLYFIYTCTVFINKQKYYSTGIVGKQQWFCFALHLLHSNYAVIMYLHHEIHKSWMSEVLAVVVPLQMTKLLRWRNTIFKIKLLERSDIGCIGSALYGIWHLLFIFFKYCFFDVGDRC